MLTSFHESIIGNGGARDNQKGDQNAHKRMSGIGGNRQVNNIVFAQIPNRHGNQKCGNAPWQHRRPNGTIQLKQNSQMILTIVLHVTLVVTLVISVVVDPFRVAVAAIGVRAASKVAAGGDIAHGYGAMLMPKQFDGRHVIVIGCKDRGSSQTSLLMTLFFFPASLFFFFSRTVGATVVRMRRINSCFRSTRKNQIQKWQASWFILVTSIVTCSSRQQG
mmetsp:Transcript_729/g.1766  ORF Transcript_729/g.1766 Transcript_729/m.1766 type:complete len:219 (+) Transcript_729:1294-1950(+)